MKDVPGKNGNIRPGPNASNKLDKNTSKLARLMARFSLDKRATNVNEDFVRCPAQGAPSPRGTWR